MASPQRSPSAIYRSPAGSRLARGLPFPTRCTTARSPMRYLAEAEGDLARAAARYSAAADGLRALGVVPQEM